MSRSLDALCGFVSRLAPRAAVEPLCAKLGGLSHRIDGARRERALERLGRALPELSLQERRAVVRESYRQRFAVLGGARCLGKRSDIDVCRGLTLSGWENLQAVEDAGSRPAFMSAPLGSPELARRALSIYRGPLAGAAGASRGRPSRDEDASGGASLFVVLGPEPCGGSAPHLHLAELSLATAAPVVPLFALPTATGYRLEVDEPLAPPASTSEVPVIARRYLEVVSRRLLAAPELWPWADLGWPP